MAAQGGHPHTWLCVACFVLCGCGSKKPAAVGGGDGGSELVDAGDAPSNAADGGEPGAELEGGSGGPPGSGGEAGPGACVPASCESLGALCGEPADGCGGSLDCGTCGDGEMCDANECRSCTALSCEELGWQCGSGSDGCSGTVDCGTCSGTAADGGGEQCYEHACCIPRECPADACGEVSDGCGGNLDCGPCEAFVTGKMCGHVSAMVCLGPDADAQ
ncbi:MAG TPA: hypothetical protein VMF89_29030, partial [Polyangiales bacterium]|nr:hypothetical protein [Polyangiales bacterium]